MNVSFIAGRAPHCHACDQPAEFYVEADGLEVTLYLCRRHALDVVQALLGAINGSDYTQVVVEVTGGVAEVTQKPVGVAVVVVDHDNGTTRDTLNAADEV